MIKTNHKIKINIEMKLRLLSLLLILTFLTSYGQKQGNIWYFGDHAGLDFNIGAPISLLNGQIPFGNGHSYNEGTSAISDSSGALLLYSNGEKVWNQSHQVMPNGDSLMGNYSSTQSCLIIPKPGSSKLFYLFTTDAFINNLRNGFRYSVIDMCLNNRLGDIVVNSKNILLLDTVAEKLTAVKHNNGIDYWIVTHKYFSDAFYAFRLSSNGIVDTIISHIGSFHQSNCGPPNMDPAGGYMKASPDGKKLAVVNLNTCNNIKEIFDFNASTGIISNWIELRLQIDSFGSYGVSFSPDNSKLYLSDVFYGKIYQYDLSAGGGQADSIRNSQTTICNLNTYLTGEVAYALQLGTDGKIYVARQNRTFLAVINHPNIKGLGCNYVDSAVSLNGKKCSLGLPNFVDSYNYSNTVVNCSDGVNEINNKDLSMKIYPNPAQEAFTIELPQKVSFSLLVNDVTGRKIYERKNAMGIVKVDCSSFSNGIYFVQAINDRNIFTYKLIKE